jgi:AcrR family transcriptional regulator
MFGEAGFERATIRGIAARAGVDPALVHHHFGAKQDLFAAAHKLPVNPAAMIAVAVGKPVDEVAETVVRLYLGVLAAPGSPALSLLRAAATNESAARMLGEYIENVLLNNAQQLTDLPDARLRIALLGSHMIGVVFARSLIGISELQLGIDELVPLLTPMVQRYLYEPLVPED